MEIMADDVRTGNWRLFSPTLDAKGLAYAELVQIGSLAPEDALSALKKLLARTKTETATGQRIQAAALVLRDVISSGWQTLASGGWLYVRPGAPGTLSKDSARRQLEFGRDDQLAETSHRKFIIALERPSRTSGVRPVTDLIADGRALLADLQAAAALEGPAREDALERACQPYLQLVTSEARCEHSGLRLMDVWRYFRHTWATRYRSTPGRNLFYLIRDAARPNHPVMGITALGNAVMQLGPRDDAIGWTLDGLRSAIADGRVTDGEVLDAFRARVLEDYSEVFIADLPVPAEPPLMVPDELLDRLAMIEKQALGDRTERLRDARETDGPAERVHDVQAADLGKLARSPLFLAKRARLISNLLRMHSSLSRAESLADLLEGSEGSWCVNQALRQLKKRFSATSMMEITVCGAVAPYNHLLGGKLACLLMMSPRVRRDYADRYREAHGIIASQMAGRPISKPSMLAFLGSGPINRLEAALPA